MAKVRYNKTIFSNGIIGRANYGRTDSDYYKASVKKVTDGIIYPQGGIKNVTLDESIGVSTNQYSGIFQIKKAKFADSTNPNDFFLIGQRKFSDGLDLIRVTLASDGSISSVTVVDTLQLGTKLLQYLVQIDNQVLCKAQPDSTVREEIYYSDTFQKYGDSVVATDTIVDAETIDINVVTDKIVINFAVNSVEGADSAVLNSITTNGFGDYTLNITVNGAEPLQPKTILENRIVTYIPTDTILDTIDVVDDIDGDIYAGIIIRTNNEETFDTPVVIDPESSVEVTEETALYKRYSQSYIKRVYDGNTNTINDVVFWKVWQTDKIILVTYEGEITSALGRVRLNIEGEMEFPYTTYDNHLFFLDIGVSGTDLTFDSSPIALSTKMNYAPVNPNFKFIDDLLDDLGYSGARYYAWKYDPINDYFEIAITSDSAGGTADIEIPAGTKVVDRPEMREVRLFGGFGRKVVGNGRKYEVIGSPKINTFDAYATTPIAKYEEILPTTLFCYSLLDVDKAKLAGKFDSRLILTQFAEGNSIIAYSRLRNYFDYTFDGTTTSDAYISEFKDDNDLRVERIIEHKTLVLFTNKGIYASSLLTTGFNPNSFSFQRVHTMIPKSDVPPEFLNGDLIFLNEDGSKVHALIELKDTQRYSVRDLTMFSNDVFESGVSLTTIDLAQELGSEFVLVSSFGLDGLVNFNSDADILSWTNLDTNGIYLKVFKDSSKVYLYDLYSHKLLETKPKNSEVTIELLEPEIEFAGGDKLSFHENYKFEEIYVKMYGEFDELSINGSDPIAWTDIPNKADRNFTVKIFNQFSDDKDLVITFKGDTDLILHSISAIIDVGE